MEYVFSLVIILVLLAAIVGCCVLFTNAIEHLGKHLNLGHGAVGCVLAAVGTALPETIVPLVAIFGAYFTKGSAQVANDIGVGAILGSPFLLLTLAMFVTALAALIFTKMGNRSLELKIDTSLLLRDLKFFVIAYTVAILTTFVNFKMLKIIIGLLLLTFYLVYVFRTILKSSNCTNLEEELEELFFGRLFRFSAKHKLILLWGQIVFSIALLIVFSHFFVENIKFLSMSLGISPFIVSLLLAPVATELPEMFNSVIWVKQSKDTLALSNISGAVVFQSCIPMSIGIFFTGWKFSFDAVLNVVIVYCAFLSLCLGILISKKKLNVTTLFVSGCFYFLYIVHIFCKI